MITKEIFLRRLFMPGHGWTEACSGEHRLKGIPGPWDQGDRGRHDECSPGNSGGAFAAHGRSRLRLAGFRCDLQPTLGSEWNLRFASEFVGQQASFRLDLSHCRL